ncbi:hypothetical protein AB0K43_30340 [Kitasatospora sp. NPDC049258]|uniref:hypothetical protein n=1 Tax=Kitasatospora sp. NPDC049258 TaxID=3155394 RepID=UPI00342FB253
MKVVIAWWDLAGSAQTVDSLREFLREEAVERWAGVEGLVLKTWIADRERGRWGAVQLWESEDALRQPLPTRAAELIGYPPTERLVFDLEATTAGPPGPAAVAAPGALAALAALAGLGPALG